MNEAHPRLGDQRPDHVLRASAASPGRTPTPRWCATPARSSATRPARSAGARRRALPDAVVACVGGGSNAMGIFTAFVGDAPVRAGGVEAGGDGLDTGQHAASLTRGRVGVLHGTRQLRAATTTARSPRRTRSAPASTTPASAPSRRTSRTRAALDVPDRDRRRGARRAARLLPRSRASSSRWRRRTPAPVRAMSPRELGRGTAACWSTSPAAATRTSSTSSRELERRAPGTRT